MSFIAAFLAWLRDLFRVTLAAPARPTIHFTFTPARNHAMASLIATGTLSAPDANVTVARRTVVYTINGGEPVTADASSGTIEVPVRDGDTLAGTVTDTSAGGVSSAPGPFSVVCRDTVTAPSTPSIAFAFAPKSS